MNGLLINEFYSLKTYIIYFSALNILYGILFIPSQGTPTFLGLVIGISIGIFYRSIIGDESTKWIYYALVTKINRKDYVLSKFLLLPIIVLGAAFEGFLIILIYNIFNTNVEFVFSTLNLITADVTISYIILMGSIILTLTFYFGYDKLILLLMLILVIPVILLNTFSSSFVLNNIFNYYLNLILILLPVLTAFVWFVCYLISVKIFENKEL